jgi:PTS system N-acetylglucosamine-specific IIC component
VTEPIEFSFMFLAPELYVVHAVLTGLSLALMNALGVRLGFTFSAGAFDYALSYGLSSRGWMLLPVGVGVFVVYYGVFLAFIRRFRLATPGREAPGAAATTAPREPAPAMAGDAERASAFVRALGGRVNLVSVDACTTRLRLEVTDSRAVDEAALRALGAKAVVRPTAGSVQVVLGPEADRVAGFIREAVRDLDRDLDRNANRDADVGREPDGEIVSLPTSLDAVPAVDAGAWVSALGGAANVLALEGIAGTRLRVELVDASRIDEPHLRKLGAPAVMRLSPSLVHVIVGAAATALAAKLSVKRN